MSTLLHEKLAAQLPALREERKKIAKEHGDKLASEVTVAQLLGGLRGVKGLVCDTSNVTAQEGLNIRGVPIGKLTDALPEEIFWMLLTGARPDKTELAALQDELHKRSAVPAHVWRMIESMPADSHPMVMLSMAVLSLQADSKFTEAYRNGIKKTDYWEYALEDSLNLLAKLPEIAAGIYRQLYKKGPRIAANPKLDWGGNFAHMLGVNEGDDFKDMVRLYLTLLSDHEGGNASAFTTNVVGSTLSDTYYTVSAGLNALAGPLHGLAVQECLRFITEILDHYKGEVPSEDELRAYCRTWLETGVIPGYGHPVLRVSDPRFVAFYAFGEKHCAKGKEFQIVQRLFKIVPDVLLEQGKAKNPWPNVDASPGSLFCYYGMREFDFYTVFFGVSRTMGYTAQHVLNLGVGASIMRPKSVGFDWVRQLVAK